MKHLKRTLSAAAVLLAACAMLMFTGCSKAPALLKRSTENNADGSLYCETTYAYDDQGRVTEKVERTYYGDEEEYRKLVYHYSGDLMIGEDIYRKNDAGEWEQDFHHAFGYDKGGEQISSLGYSVENGVQEIFAIDLSQVDEQGRLTQTTAYMNDEETHTMTAYVRMVFTYDDKEHTTREEYYTQGTSVKDEGNLVKDATYVYTYNEDGTLKENSSYAPDGTVYYIARYTYDEYGNQLTEVDSRFDENGNEEVYFRSTGEVDGKGRLIRRNDESLDEDTNTMVPDGYVIYEY